jgi:uncharacterized membrane protein YhaH (DUF805 family)
MLPPGDLRDANPLVAIWILAVLLPTLAVSVRRLHDIDKTGWWYLIILIPTIGFLVLIYWACLKGTTGPNRFSNVVGAVDHGDGFDHVGGGRHVQRR